MRAPNNNKGKITGRRRTAHTPTRIDACCVPSWLRCGRGHALTCPVSAGRCHAGAGREEPPPPPQPPYAVAAVTTTTRRNRPYPPPPPRASPAVRARALAAAARSVCWLRKRGGGGDGGGVTGRAVEKVQWCRVERRGGAVEGRPPPKDPPGRGVAAAAKRGQWGAVDGEGDQTG